MGERAAADDPLDAAPDTLPELSVGGDDPQGRVEDPDILGDPVIRRFGSLPDDDHVMTVFAAPFETALLELRPADVRPDGTSHVLGVDEHCRHGFVVSPR